MSAEGTVPAVTADAGQAEAARPRRRWLLGSATLLLAAALLAAVLLSAAYQPVRYGDDAAAVQGPVSSSIRAVNTFGNMRGQLYIPPQHAADGTLLVSLANTGPYPVTIESVSMPSYPNALNDQTGPATYLLLPPIGVRPKMPTASSPKIAGATLRPGTDVLIRIPFRTPGCWMSGGSTVSSFLVTATFLWWTHTFAVSWTPPWDPNGGAIMSQLPNPNGC
jgi:hypothetical protein